MRKSLKLLDLFSGAGGAAMGYHQAGFTDITGIDINPQKRYPFRFDKRDALEVLEYYLSTGFIRQFDLIHASPPCQTYSRTNTLANEGHPDHVEYLRSLLKATEIPYVIEKVVGAPLENPIMLCGTMFGLKTVRHRLFECSFPITVDLECNHYLPVVPLGKRPLRGKQFHSVVGHFIDIEYAKECMGIDWMIGKEMAQAIPPAYTKYVGEKFIELL